MVSTASEAQAERKQDCKRQSSQSLEERLLDLKLHAKDPEQAGAIDKVVETFKDVLSSGMSVANLVDSDHEALWWQCFAEVYEKEIVIQKGAKNAELSKLEKQQILADILVWAEITQEHYDPNTASFVMQPHQGDKSFLRIGKFLAEVKESKGLAKAKPSSSEVSEKHLDTTKLEDSPQRPGTPLVPPITNTADDAV